MTLGGLQAAAKRGEWRDGAYVHRGKSGKGATEAMQIFVEDCIKERLCEVVRMANDHQLSLDHLGAALDKEMRK